MARWKYVERPEHSENRRADARYADAGLETQCLHAGERWEKWDVWSSSTPIFPGTHFFYDSVEERTDRTWFRKHGYTYARTGSPTSSTLERALSTIEGAEVTRTCPSGMAAVHLALLTAGAAHDGLILCSRDVYGSVYTLVQNVLPDLGVPTILMDFLDLGQLEETMQRVRPAVVHFEVMSNPLCRIVDAPAVIEMAHRYGARVVIDNTFCSPYVFRPIDYGCDFVVHSLTKYLNGHADVLGGSVSCARKDYARLYDVQLQIASSLDPFDAWLTLRGLKTYPLRIERQCRSAMEVARYLEGHPLVRSVAYAGLPSHPQYATARRIFTEGRYGGMLSFELAGCESEAHVNAFMNALKMILPTTSEGDIYSVVINPSLTTHHWLDDEELAHIAISRGTFRMSVGIETVDDIIADLAQAMGRYAAQFGLDVPGADPTPVGATEHLAAP